MRSGPPREDKEKYRSRHSKKLFFGTKLIEESGEDDSFLQKFLFLIFQAIECSSSTSHPYGPAVGRT